jgi:hypothetical protein
MSRRPPYRGFRRQVSNENEAFSRCRCAVDIAYATDESDPPLPRFRPWQQVWQCNDIRVTITGRDPFSVEYDLGGTIWGGGHFTVIKGALSTSTSDLVYHCNR